MFNQTISLTTPNSSNVVKLRKNKLDYIAYYTVFCNKDYRITFPKRLGEPKVIVDLGANVGFSGIFFSEKFNQAKIISVEPDRSNFSALSDNTKNYGNIAILNRGIWGSEATLTKQNKQSDGLSDSFIEVSDSPLIADKGSDIKAITIHQLIEQYELETIDILKMDIEGAEKMVMGGDTRWLKKVRLLMIEIHNGCWKSVFDALKKYDYDACIVGEVVHILFTKPKKDRA